MKTKLGIIFMILGVVLLISALLLVFYNFNENDNAQKASEEMLQGVVDEVNQRIEEKNKGEASNTALNPYDTEMTVVEIDGYKFIGYISIPKLENLELPVMSEWNYDLLKMAPCRYTGSAKSDDLVLLGHNYTSHFGKLSRLTGGDKLYFTDMDGNTFEYEVIGVELLSSTSIEEMTSGEYDLSLFTCDYSGNNRFTVRCNKINRLLCDKRLFL